MTAPDNVLWITVDDEGTLAVAGIKNTARAQKAAFDWFDSTEEAAAVLDALSISFFDGENPGNNMQSVRLNFSVFQANARAETRNLRVHFKSKQP